MAEFWQRWKKTVLALIVFGSLAFSLGFFYHYHLPQLKSWLLVETEKQTRKHLPVRLWPQEVDVQLFPPSVRFNQVHILPQAPLNKVISPSSLEGLEVKLNWFALLRGNLRVSELKLIRPTLHLRLKNVLTKPNKEADPSPAPTKSKSIELKSIYSTPLDNLVIEDLNLIVESQSEHLLLQLKKADIQIENRFDSLLVSSNLPNLRLKKDKLPPLNLSLETRFLIDDKNLQISALKVKTQSSFLVASGHLKGELMKGNLRTGKISTRTHFNLPKLRLLAQGYLEKTKLPPMKGSAELDFKLKWEAGRYPDIPFQIRTRDVEVDKFVIGNLETDGVLTKEQISLKKLYLHNSAGIIHLTDTVINRKDSWKFTTQFTTEQVVLHRLLTNLKVPRVPVHLDIAGELPCSGEFQPKFKLSCSGQLRGANLSVHSGGKKKNPIVELDQFSVDGNLTVDTKKVFYNANIKIGEFTKGRSDGVISFAKGFDINYEADHLDFRDVKKLAQLNIEGSGKIKGRTKGNSKHATVRLNIIDAKKMWLGGYGLGQVQSKVRYKNGILTFRRIKGLYRSSRYIGKLSINLLKNNIHFTGKFPHANLSDLRSLFKRHYELPFPISGIGNGEVTAWGPLAFNQLNYNLKASFYRGSVNNESYDEIVFQVGSRNGNAMAEKIYLSKANSRITLKGGIKNTGKMDLVIVGHNLQLEHSTALEKLYLNMVGVLNFTTSLHGPIRQPKIDIQGRLSHLMLDNRPYKDSNFKMKFTAQTIQGSGNFMGNLIKSKFLIPLNKEAPFQLFVKTNDFDFSQLFNVFAGLSTQKGFKTRLTSTINLQSDRGGFLKSTGEIKISELFVSRGSASMSAPKPILLNFKNGVLNSKSFNLVGHNTYITLSTKNSSRDNLNLDLSGKIDMSLCLLLTPFLADLRGLLSISGQLGGSVDSPELSGSAFVEKGLIRIKGFPHPMEQIRADLLFNQKNILINTANGSLAGGPFTADGQIWIYKFNEIPVKIKGLFKNISLEIPKGVRTRGSGHFTLTGKWFPYTLGGTLNVLSGDITKELSSNLQNSNKIQPSSLLPDFLVRDSFQPITLNLMVNLRSPITIKNSLVESQVKGLLKIQGSFESLQLEGELNILKEGKVFFNDTPFEVSLGRVKFDKEDPDNPIIYLDANTRAIDKYDINMIIQGKSKDPKINLTSQPPLSPEQIIALLALKIDPSAEENVWENSDELALETSIQIGNALLKKPLDDINTLTGVEVGVSGVTGTDGTLVPSLTLKKQWTPKFGMSASRTVESRPANNAKLEYKMNRNFSFIGSWENKEGTPEIKDTAIDKVGVDFEYKVEFK